MIDLGGCEPGAQALMANRSAAPINRRAWIPPAQLRGPDAVRRGREFLIAVRRSSCSTSLELGGLLEPLHLGYARREIARQRRCSMQAEFATTNVNRSYWLGATSITIFTFMLFFLYPRYASGEVSALLFQATLLVMGVATFSFVFASLHYYGASLASRMDDADRALYARRGDRFWLLGYTLLFLAPSMILFTVRLFAVGSVWFALWLVYLLFVARFFPRVQTAPTS
jgi:hypothetical protein